VNTCAHCDLDIGGTPYAFPLTDMRVDAYDRFCSEACVHAYEATLEPCVDARNASQVCPHGGTCITAHICEARIKREAAAQSESNDPKEGT
jgi:hypothetical protein